MFLLQKISALSICVTNKRWAALIVGDSYPNIQKEENEDILVEHYYATIISEGTSDTWYIATCEGTYKMGHLMRVRDGNNLKWKHPPKRDLLSLHIDSILDF